jgi:hypothetical protein
MPNIYILCFSERASLLRSLTLQPISDRLNSLTHAAGDFYDKAVTAAESLGMRAVPLVPVGNLIWLAVDRESGDAVVQ